MSTKGFPGVSLSRVPLVLAMVLGLVLVPAGAPANLVHAAGSPSSFCHVTDGTFTACPNGGNEWSDVPAQPFPASQSFLYADQADLDPTRGSPHSPVDTFMLMYDECGLTTPLGPNEYFLLNFETVEM